MHSDGFKGEVRTGGPCKTIGGVRELPPQRSILTLFTHRYHMHVDEATPRRSQSEAGLTLDGFSVRKEKLPHLARAIR